MGRYLSWLEAERGLALATYADAWRWSVDEPGAFWQSIWDHFGVRSATAPGPALAEPRMPGATWFPGATLNYAEHALALPGRAADDVVVIGRSQTRDTGRPDRRRAARRRRALPRGPDPAGRRRGDRVAAFLPNVPEAVDRRCSPRASLGATWSSCAPEFGTRAVVDRFGQIEPTVLLAIDGYRYGDKVVDRSRGGGRGPRRAAQPPGDRRAPLSPIRGGGHRRGPRRDRMVGAGRRARPARRSSPCRSTTRCTCCSRRGRRGCRSRSSTGTAGSCSSTSRRSRSTRTSGPTDRFCWFTTTGWMMWNYLVSGLAVGSTIVLFDGNPAWPDLSTLWRLAAETRTTYLGAERAVPHGLPLGRPRARAGARPVGAARRRARRARRCPRPGSAGSPTPSRTRSRSARSAAGPTCARASSGRRRWCPSGRARSAAGCSAPGSRRSIRRVGRSSTPRASS